MSTHEIKGYNVVRRLQTEGAAPWWPETVAQGFSFKEAGWLSYFKQVYLFTGQLAAQILRAIDADLRPDDIPAHEWAVGLFLACYRKDQGWVPCAPGIGPDIVDYVIDERMFSGDGKVGIRCSIMQPHKEDCLPNGTRLPMTQVECLTHEVGSVEIFFWVNKTGLPEIKVTGVLEEDFRVLALVEKMRVLMRKETGLD